MSEEKKIISWEELAKAEDVTTKTVRCPNLSDQLGTDVFVKVRAVTSLELVKAINFPLDEINQLTADGADDAEYAKAYQEHCQTFSSSELVDALESVVSIGLVEPDPGNGNLKKLSADFETIFTEVVQMTIPKEAADQAGQFPSDGE